MERTPFKYIEYCPFCGQKTLDAEGGLIVCLNDKCETEPFAMYGGHVEERG